MDQDIEKDCRCGSTYKSLLQSPPGQSRWHHHVLILCLLSRTCRRVEATCRPNSPQDVEALNEVCIVPQKTCGMFYKCRTGRPISLHEHLEVISLPAPSPVIARVVYIPSQWSLLSICRTPVTWGALCFGFEGLWGTSCASWEARDVVWYHTLTTSSSLLFHTEAPRFSGIDRNHHCGSTLRYRNLGCGKSMSNAAREMRLSTSITFALP